MVGILIRREEEYKYRDPRGETAGRRHGGRDRSDVSMSQGTPRFASPHQRQGERLLEEIPPQDSMRSQPCQHHALGLLTSRRQGMNLLFDTPPFAVLCYGKSRKLIHCLFSDE